MSSRIITILIVFSLLSTLSITLVANATTCTHPTHTPPMPPNWDGKTICSPKPTTGPINGSCPTPTPTPSPSPTCTKPIEQGPSCKTIVNIVDVAPESFVVAPTDADVATPTPVAVTLPSAPATLETPSVPDDQPPAANADIAPWLAGIFAGILLLVGAYLYFIRK